MGREGPFEFFIENSWFRNPMKDLRSLIVFLSASTIWTCTTGRVATLLNNYTNILLTTRLCICLPPSARSVVNHNQVATQQRRSQININEMFGRPVQGGSLSWLFVSFQVPTPSLGVTREHGSWELRYLLTNRQYIWTKPLVEQNLWLNKASGWTKPDTNQSRAREGSTSFVQFLNHE